MSGAQSVVVLFGTETGNAREAALAVAERLQRRGVPSVSLKEVDDTNVAEWPSMGALLLFVCSTTGQGAFPRTMARSWSELRMTDAPDMDGLRFAVFGLGDSSYAKFNYVAKLLHNRLVQLGGTAVAHRGLGDDQDFGGYEREMGPWLDRVCTAVGVGAADIVDVPPLLSVAVHSCGSAEASSGPLRSAGEGGSCRINAVVAVNRRMTAATHFQQVHHIELTAAAQKDRDALHSFAPGDSLSVYAPCPNDLVARAAAVFGLQLDDIVVVTPSYGAGALAAQPSQPHFGVPITAHALLTHQIDLCATATRRFLHMLSRFAADEEERERLLELASASRMDEFITYCHREKRNVVEVLEDFPRIRPPLAHVLSCVPAMRARAFSISSAPCDATLHLTVAKLQFTTPYKRVRVGLCSGWLCDAPEGAAVECYITPGTIGLPETPSPLILIGPGTGIAPMRSMLRAITQPPLSDAGWGTVPVVLFTGNRTRDGDFLYGDEFTEVAQRVPSVQHFAVFSRDGDKLRYVQHRMAEVSAARRVGELLLGGAHVFVCGNAKQMPRDVENTLGSIAHHFVTKTGDEADGERYVAQLKKEGRLQMETWSS